MKTIAACLLNIIVFITPAITQEKDSENHPYSTGL